MARDNDLCERRTLGRDDMICTTLDRQQLPGIFVRGMHSFVLLRSVFMKRGLLFVCFSLSLFQYRSNCIQRSICSYCNWDFRVKASKNWCRTKSFFEVNERLLHYFAPNERSVACEGFQGFGYGRTISTKSTIIVHKSNKCLDFGFLRG